MTKNGFHRVVAQFFLRGAPDPHPAKMKMLAIAIGIENCHFANPPLTRALASDPQPKGALHAFGRVWEWSDHAHEAFSWVSCMNAPFLAGATLVMWCI